MTVRCAQGHVLSRPRMTYTRRDGRVVGVLWTCFTCHTAYLVGRGRKNAELVCDVHRLRLLNDFGAAT